MPRYCAVYDVMYKTIREGREKSNTRMQGLRQSSLGAVVCYSWMRVRLHSLYAHNVYVQCPTESHRDALVCVYIQSGIACTQCMEMEIREAISLQPPPLQTCESTGRKYEVEVQCV